MALLVPCPIVLASGVYHFNIRMPADIAGQVRGTTFVLRVNGREVAERASDKVIVSLRTKDPTEAKHRFSEAQGCLLVQWQAVREGPKPLPQRDVVGLAGEAYRARVDRHQSDPKLDDAFLAREVEGWLGVADAPTTAGPGGSAAQALDWVAFHLTTHGRDAISVSEDVDGLAGLQRIFLERIYGDEVNALLATRGLVVDPSTRDRLLREVARAADEAARPSATWAAITPLTPPQPGSRRLPHPSRPPR